MKGLVRLLAAAALWLVAGLALAQSVLPVPPLSGRVIDQTGTLSAAQAIRGLRLVSSSAPGPEEPAARVAS